METLQYGLIRQLGPNEDIPFELLLLADESLEAIHKYIHDAIIHVLEKEEEMIAVYVLQKVKAESVEIKNIAVKESYQGQGIGKYLLKEASKEARKMGYKNLLIGTSNGAIMQLYLYQKEGFEIVGIRKNFFMENYPKPIYENGIHCKHMIVMQKSL